MLIDSCNKPTLYTVNTKQEKSLSTDGGFSFSGSIQEVIKFREYWKKPAFAEMSQFTEVKFQISLAFLHLI